VSYLIHYSGKSAIEQVGAKALNLSRLLRYGLRVPEAWFLPVSALHDFMQENRLDGHLVNLKKSSGQSLKACLSAAAELRREIRLQQLQPALLAELKNFVHGLNTETAQANFSVRSSSINEDLEQHSFAGQYSSVLNVPPLVTSLCKNIKVVWASQWSDQIISYAFKHSLPIPAPEMGVIIQRMIRPDIAGVLFSNNPYTFNKNEMIVEYVHGLGEALVSGEETPVHLTYNRNQKILNKGKEILSKTDLRAINILIDTASMLEKKTGLAVDIEWAFADGEMYYLQMRSITNFGQTGILWTDENVGEVIPDIVTPYTWSILNPVTNNAFKMFLEKLGIKDYPAEGLFGLYKGKVYFNSTAFQQTLNRFYLSGYQGGGNDRLVEKILHRIFVPFRLFGALLRFFRFSARLPRMIKEYLHGYVPKLKEISYSAKMEGVVSYKRMARIVSLHGKTMFFHISDTILAELFYQFLKKITDRWVQPKTGFGADALLTGMGEAESALSGEALWDIAMTIKKSPRLSDIFDLPDAGQIESRLAESDEGKNILAALDGFIRRYGHGALHEFELLYPRWWEDRSYIYTNIRTYLKTEIALDFEGSHKKLTVQRKDNLKTALRLIPFVLKPVFKYLYKKAAYFSGERENLKQAFIKAHSELKKHLLNTGRLLQNDGILKRRDDILFLRHEEIKKYIQDIPVKDAIISELDIRRANRSRFIREEHPARMMQIGELWRPVYDEGPAGDDDLKGIGCSAGIVEGRACIILNDSQFSRLKQGDVLIAPSTNPGWTPLFVVAAAVVTEIGGALSHGAIIAREYGIPMVAAVKKATIKIKDGDRVRVNGHTGLVHILEN